MLIDSHCHLDAPEFDADRDQVWRRAQTAGVQKVVVPAVEASNFQTVRDLAHQHDGVYYALGIHPLYVPRAQPSDLRLLEETVQQALEDPCFVGIGEIGLDFFVPELCTPEMRERQLAFYEQQLKLAVRYNLPVILHVRRSVDVITKHLRQHPTLRGIAHAFNGSQQQAEILLDLGFKLGFGGAMTFERAKQIRRLASDLPLTAIVLETDAPDIPPAWLGKAGEEDDSPLARRNEPAHLARMAQVLAELRGVPLETITQQTGKNALEVLPRLAQ